jgi:hypothetical protein
MPGIARLGKRFFILKDLAGEASAEIVIGDTDEVKAVERWFRLRQGVEPICQFAVEGTTVAALI